MELVGRQPQYTCKTPELDHPGMVDFSIGNKAVFVENVDGFVEAGTCFGVRIRNPFMKYANSLFPGRPCKQSDPSFTEVELW